MAKTTKNTETKAEKAAAAAKAKAKKAAVKTTDQLWDEYTQIKSDHAAGNATIEQVREAFAAYRKANKEAKKQ